MVLASCAHCFMIYDRKSNVEVTGTKVCNDERGCYLKLHILEELWFLHCAHCFMIYDRKSNVEVTGTKVFSLQCIM